MSHLNQIYLNRPFGFICPLNKIEDGDVDPKSYNYDIEDTYVLFTINITDKTFGEIIFDLNEFRNLPECKSIREL